MSFSFEHTVSGAPIAGSEASPNATPPAVARVWSSPSQQQMGGQGDYRGASGFASLRDGTSAAVTFWVRDETTRVWTQLGASQTLLPAAAGQPVMFPPAADVFMRIGAVAGNPTTIDFAFIDGAVVGFGTTGTAPAGAATSALQTTGNTSLASIDGKIPAAPSTAGNQTTGNTSLASIDGKIPASPATAGNQTTANTSLSSIDGKIPASPATAGNQTTGNTSLSSIDGKSPAAAAMADAETNVTTMSRAGARLAGYNGTTWDMLRTALTAVSSTFTGILNVLPRTIYNSSPATRTNGQHGPMETDATGNLRTAEQFAPAYEDNTAARAVVEHRFNYTNVVGTTTGVSIKSGAGVLHTMIIAKPAANAVITLYDGLSTAGTKICTFTLPATVADGSFYLFDTPFSTGLFVVVATGATDLCFSTR